MFRLKVDIITRHNDLSGYWYVTEMFFDDEMIEAFSHNCSNTKYLFRSFTDDVVCTNIFCDEED